MIDVAGSIASSNMGGVQARHPSYQERIVEWQMLRDTYRGEQAVKLRGEHYLPIPSGFKAQWSKGGSDMYDAYVTRAMFPDIVRPTVAGIIGIIHRVAAEIELPPALEHLRENSTPDGLTLEALHRKITSEVLLMGRYGILADLPEDGGDVYLCGYNAEAIINWADIERDFYVLDETRIRRVGFAWMNVPRFRVLEIVDNAYEQSVWEFGAQQSPASADPEGAGKISPGPGSTSQLTPVEPSVPTKTNTATPSTANGKSLDRVPFVIVGAKDITARVDESPSIGIARSALAIYRLDADYRWQLFSTGQETLFVSGVDPMNNPVDAVGAGVVYTLPDPASKAFYVGPTGIGINAHRQAIIDQRAVAISEGARLFAPETTRPGVESGEALRLRFTAESSALVDIANASAAGLEMALRNAAEIVGADPNAVVVTPNLEFIDSRMTPQDALFLTQVWQSGAMSYETLWAAYQEGELAPQDRTAQEERDLIEQELPALAKEKEILNPQPAQTKPGAKPNNPALDVTKQGGLP